MNQKELAKCLIEIQHVIEFVEDNGSGLAIFMHVCELKRTREMLRSNLTAENKEKFDIWLSKRTEGA